MLRFHEKNWSTTWAMEGIDARSPKSNLVTKKSTHYVGPKVRTLTNHIALKQWTYNSTLWSLMAAHLAVGRFVEIVQCIKRRSFHFCIYNVVASRKHNQVQQ
jgi:hypothetical protein